MDPIFHVPNLLVSCRVVVGVVDFDLFSDFVAVQVTRVGTSLLGCHRDELIKFDDEGILINWFTVESRAADHYLTTSSSTCFGPSR